MSAHAAGAATESGIRTRGPVRLAALLTEVSTQRWTLFRKSPAERWPGRMLPREAMPSAVVLARVGRIRNPPEPPDRDDERAVSDQRRRLLRVRPVGIE